LAGIERFAVEFLRPNPRMMMGLSEAQIIAMILTIIGLFGWRKLTAESSTT